MVKEGIEVHFVADDGHLRVDCANGEFDRIRDLVIIESGASDQVDPFVDAIESILVRRRPASESPTRLRFARGFRLAVIALVLAVAAAIQVVGLVQVAAWMWRLGG